MKVEIINSFLEATVSVIKTMASVDLVPGKPFIKKGSISTGDISGIVGMAGESEGSLSLSFSKECILYIVSSMFGEPFTEITEEVKDAVGELTNMISGDARRRLETAGILYHGAIPSVISGPNHEIRHVTKEPIISIPFDSANGGFHLELCFK
jgi:chemotaxis protein CheX